MNHIDFSAVILNTYSQTWFMWIGFLVFGFLLLKFSDVISVSKRDKNKKESAAISMMAIGIVVHISVIVALFKSV
ncbi:MAG: hypothetical protein M0Q24_01525 [Sulfurimonas sp.]|uniref:hypothetical protein n=1 Tax=Sulfurimonas sp. TaxID=2022749 RepID=UPI0025FF4084|nr:hypothetical protein [Sulfurimonas sp.]MCK9490743.1 hypothetical protein [Sulfurimonas sp.]